MMLPSSVPNDDEYDVQTKPLVNFQEQEERRPSNQSGSYSGRGSSVKSNSLDDDGEFKTKTRAFQSAALRGNIKMEEEEQGPPKLDIGREKARAESSKKNQKPLLSMS